MKTVQIDATMLVNEMAGAVYSVLKELQVNPKTADYEDYVQNGFILLLTIGEEFKGDPLGDERYQFVAYFKRRFRWHLLDLFRLHDRQRWLMDDPSSMEGEGAVDCYEQSFVDECLERLPSELHELFLRLYWDQPTKTVLAKEFGISRKTLYQRIYAIRSALEDLR
ncbi:sigma-70 family RNA polymerase sigma factor [Atopobacter phocae]|uniref:sigma-70 family RNA polymerase sigma factor n=1 Tax=Atopobacter phocae TaxID=136492 RepID=UPI0004705B6B|nr:sigma-70 family RNA polymerase sigma factor [Atopobacter phocae]